MLIPKKYIKCKTYFVHIFVDLFYCYLFHLFNDSFQVVMLFQYYFLLFETICRKYHFFMMLKYNLFSDIIKFIS